jgi:DNA-binding protein
MHTQKTPQSNTTNVNDIIENNELIVTDEPVMKIAIDMLSKFSLTNKLVLKAYGEFIPNAVAIANIITDNILKGNSKIDKISLNSEISEEVGMVSNIQIVLLKN